MSTHHHTQAAATVLPYRAAPRSWSMFGPRTLVRIALISAGLFAVVTWGPLSWRKVELIYWQSRCLNHTPPSVQAAASNANVEVPHEWARFYQLLSPPGMNSAGTAFLGGRTSPAGNRRLVAVDVSHTMADSNHATARLFVPGGLLSRPREVLHPIGAVQLPAGGVVVSGRADPRDPSHFTFICEAPDAQHVIDGWLRDDDTVLLEVRPPGR